jgi:phosphoribosyl-dephospho-CoA transferase
VAKVTAQSKSNWKREPAVAAVVTVPGPIKAADITDQIITLEMVLFLLTSMQA